MILNAPQCPSTGVLWNWHECADLTAEGPSASVSSTSDMLPAGRGQLTCLSSLVKLVDLFPRRLASFIAASSLADRLLLCAISFMLGLCTNSWQSIQEAGSTFLTHMVLCPSVSAMQMCLPQGGVS